jgi:hypothetical protein
MMLHAHRLRMPIGAGALRARELRVESPDPFSFDARGELAVLLPSHAVAAPGAAARSREPP